MEIINSVNDNGARVRDSFQCYAAAQVTAKTFCSLLPAYYSIIDHLL